MNQYSHFRGHNVELLRALLAKVLQRAAIMGTYPFALGQLMDDRLARQIVGQRASPAAPADVSRDLHRGFFMFSIEYLGFGLIKKPQLGVALDPLARGCVAPRKQQPDALLEQFDLNLAFDKLRGLLINQRLERINVIGQLSSGFQHGAHRSIALAPANSTSRSTVGMTRSTDQRPQTTAE